MKIQYYCCCDIILLLLMLCEVWRSWLVAEDSAPSEVAIDEERNVNKARYTQRIQRKNT